MIVLSAGHNALVYNVSCQIALKSIIGHYVNWRTETCNHYWNDMFGRNSVMLHISLNRNKVMNILRI